jgi:hypothetical protein
VISGDSPFAISGLPAVPDPFKRNDAMLEAMPIGVLVFPGSGIQDNLADKARKMGIPVWKIL